MDDQHPYIKQQAEDESLYSHLQKKTLEEVQRLSGKVWTDFNAHDPGITLADIANYALTETNYKLGFGTVDYLTPKNGTFEPKLFGLFPPEEVYTTAPVTLEDYRKLFFAHIPELDNVWVECDTATGGYTVRVVLSPFEEENEKAVIKQIKKVYNSHRNLCEFLGEVMIVHPEELEFHAEFEIKPGEDASIVLAKLYGVILRYLSGGVYISTPEEQPLSGISPEEWLEGSEDAVRVVIPRQQNTEYELYKKLWLVEGIQSFSTCYLMKDGKPLTDFSGGFSLKIPDREQDLKVCIRCGRSVMEVDIKKFTRHLEAFYYTKGHIRTKENNRKGVDWGNMKGTYRDIFAYSPIAGEFPACYRLSSDRETPTSFEAYLKWYDLIMQRGLQEIKELPQLLSIETEDKGIHSLRNIYALKSRYLNFLDSLYCVESQPVWMEEFGNYGETEEAILCRRTGFLRHIARLTKNRARARDISDEDGKENIATVKEWFCRLLAINRDENRSVGNILPGHNLVLMRTDEKNKRFRDRLTAMLISERMLDSKHVETIRPVKLTDDKKEKLEQYGKLRTELPVFNHNFISSGLFRGGTFLDNYRIVPAAENEYMLAFYNQEEKSWMNLGRTDDKVQLNLLANILHRYLRELNQECETLYIVEPVLTDIKQPFILSLVLPLWTARFHTPRFQEVCHDLLRSLLPAHLKGTIYWLGVSSMQEFEDGYRLWRKALARQNADDAQILLESINEILQNAKKYQLLNDTD